ncbi:hypothetical protein CAPTEDRAFT_209532 [Capitella teleta]|uniref:Alpha-macroglobulin-like TED domain-containing protein n=1 Tax=Capitella teleta TaxID=283909 RepID=R7T6F0_CAPTE|nr:hypothetical protein CAPTEDRAFT_209532 [Capitella teleta]|eukprot:ELT88893.1 hypothetical protein CAPTEDRAFT_209532 [Capitella teleta]
MLIIFGIITFNVAVLTAESRLLDGKLDAASNRGLDYIAQYIDDHGKFSAPYVIEKDLCHYYMLPWILFSGGKLREADLVLDFIKINFMQPDGDFRTSQAIKACHPFYSHHYTYANIFIARGAIIMERYDVLAPALKYLQQYNKKFPTEGPPSDGHTITSMDAASRYGILALHTGDMKTAKRAAKLIMRFIELQPNTDDGFYYQMNNNQLITEFSANESFRFVVSRTAPYQAFMVISDSAEFLAKLSIHKGFESYMKPAKELISWLSTCDDSLYSTFGAVKVGIATSWVGALSGDSDAKDIAARIAPYLLSLQNDDGSFSDAIIPGSSSEYPYSMQIIDALASV